jgi:hypothetical protein
MRAHLLFRNMDRLIKPTGGPNEEQSVWFSYTLQFLLTNSPTSLTFCQENVLICITRSYGIGSRGYFAINMFGFRTLSELLSSKC